VVVGSSMWGGRRPEDVGEQRTIRVVNEQETPDSPEVDTVWAVRPLVSLALVVLGVTLLSVGLGLILGVGGALAGVGLVALVVGIMLGMGGDET